MNFVKDYWLEAIKDVFYRKPFLHMDSLKRTVADLSLTFPGNAWHQLGFTLEDLGYSPKHKRSNWVGFYFPPQEEWDRYEAKVRALKSSSTFFATFSLPLKGEKIKEETVHNTKGNCLLNVVIGFYRANSKGPLSCRVWIVSRSSEVFTKFGADLYFTQTILLPRLLEVPRQVFPDLVLEEVVFYLCSAYLVGFRLLGLTLWPEPVDILKEAWSHNRYHKQEQQFIRGTVKDILKAIEAPESLSYRARVKLSYLYRESWLPFKEDILKLWREIENVGD